MAAEALPLVKGTLDVLVLKGLSWGAMHGFEITSWLEAHSSGRLDVDDSALYQSRHRMEDGGLDEADGGVAENNRRARYHRITPAGRAHLHAESARWVRYAETVTSTLTARQRAVPA